jgi:hypothetical protein
MMLSGRGQLAVVGELRLLTDAEGQFEAFADLAGYLSWHVAPCRRPGILAGAGERRVAA